MAKPDQVVAIGASAGGLEPLQEFFEAIPNDSGMAFVVVQHLSPDHPSLMDELLARHTKMPVQRVTDGMEIKADRVYLIPAKTYMRVEDEVLRLTEQARDRDKPPTPIDVFFESLAACYRDRGAAVVLSGTGSDGSRGLRAVHEAGGRTIVQDGTAKFDGMPQAAINTGMVDMILPPAEMPDFLLGREDEDGQRPSLVGSAPGIYEVLEVLREQHDLDFAHYKIATVLRRIERRIQLTQATSVSNYLSKLRESREEQDKLYRDLLIGVTRFFRDPDAFRVLEERVLPAMIARTTPESDSLRVWVAGCASGEEAYSIAMLIHEAASRANKAVNARIFATDAHRGSIEFASAGKYHADLLDQVSRERRDRYFSHIGDEYHVSPLLRSMITFAPHNILADAPFTRMDLVVCRNMLIYFKPAAQQRAIALFHFALKVGATLMLGSSETVGRLHEELPALDAHWRVYTKRRDARLLVDADLSALGPRNLGKAPAAPIGPIHSGTDVRIQKAYDGILEDLLPVGMLLNERRELVHTFGKAQQILTTPTGRFSQDVLEMVDPDLRVALSAALVRSTKERRSFRYENVNVTLDGERKPRVVVTKPLDVAPNRPPYTLVTIQDPPSPPRPVENLAAVESYELDELSAQKIAALEHELQYTKENLQATIEEMETTNEELNATNEELIASNEELQSTNEELQSVNEELHTVNAEHQQKITELTNLTDDMNNLLDCTDIGTLFLDADMCVRKFTPAVQDHFRLREQDLGRPLEEIASRIDHPAMLSDARRVFETGEPLEFESLGGGGVLLLVRLTPYKTGRGRIDGVVISLVDVSRLKAAEALAANLAEQNQLILDHIPALVWYKDLDSRVIRANRAVAEATGIPLEQIEGARTEDLHPGEAGEYIHSDREVMTSGKPKLGIVEALRGAEGGQIWVNTDKVPIRAGDGHVSGLLVVATDITALKRTESELREVSHKLQVSMAGANLGAWDWEPASGDVHYSDTWYTMLGYEPSALPMTFATWESLTHPEDVKRAMSIMERHLAGELDRYDVTVRMRRSDGEWKWIRSVGELFGRDEDGTPLHVAGMHIDVDFETNARAEMERIHTELEALVTERTQDLQSATARFERTIEASQQGLWEWSVDEDEIWFADQFWHILGFSSDERPPNTLAALNDRLHPEDCGPLWDACRAASDSGAPLRFTYRLRDADGAYRWVRSWGVVGKDAQSQRRVMSGSIIDVHETVSAEAELHRSKEELEQRVASRTAELSGHLESLADRNEQLDQFAHVASHDLRAPLRTIAGFAELAMRSNGDAESRNQQLSRILSSTRRMNALLDSLSAYSKVGRATLEPTETDLDDLVRGVCADLEADIQQFNATVSHSELGKVRADARLLRQVFLNLVGNALKFTSDDRVPIVSIEREDRAEVVILRVRDNGIGIEAEYFAEIFEPFRRLHASEQYTGSGVGLSVCRRIVERHGGEIWVESTLGEGSTFVLSLPRELRTDVAELRD